MEKKISEVGAEDLGVLIPYSEKDDIPAKLYVQIVDLARENGYDILAEVWESDKPLFLQGEATEEMMMDLEIVADFATQFLEELLPAGFEFDFDIERGMLLVEENRPWFAK